MNYNQIGTLNIKEIPDLEIQIIPTNDVFVVQLSSPFLRGTLVLDEQYDKEDMIEITKIMCDMIEDLTIIVDESLPAN